MAKLRTANTNSNKRLVAIRTGSLNRSITPSGGTNYKEVQSWFNTKICYDTDNIEVGWSNFIRNPSYNGTTVFEEFIPSGTGFSVRAAAEYGGSIYPLYKNGQRDMRVESGETVKFDPLTGVPMTAGGTLVIRYKIIADSIPSRWMTWENHQSYLGAKNEMGDGLTDRTLQVSAWSPSNPSTYAIMAPNIIIGSTTNGKSFEICGDSIGSNSQSDGGSNFDLGFIQKTMFSKNIPYFSNGGSGLPFWIFCPSDITFSNNSSGFTSSKNRRRAVVPAGSCDFFLLQMITNDLAWTKSYNTCVANLLELKAEMDSLGKKLIPMTCPPRTNSSNNAKFTYDGASVFSWRNSWNNYIRSNNGCGYGYFDVAAVLSSSAGGATPDINGDYWLTIYLADGIHPNSSGHDALQAGLESKIAELTQTWKAR